jgi:hypothetical protein
MASKQANNKSRPPLSGVATSERLLVRRSPQQSFGSVSRLTAANSALAFERENKAIAARLLLGSHCEGQRMT